MSAEEIAVEEDGETIAADILLPAEYVRVFEKVPSKRSMEVEKNCLKVARSNCDTKKRILRASMVKGLSEVEGGVEVGEGFGEGAMYLLMRMPSDAIVDTAAARVVATAAPSSPRPYTRHRRKSPTMLVRAEEKMETAGTNTFCTPRENPIIT